MAAKRRRTKKNNTGKLILVTVLLLALAALALWGVSALVKGQKSSGGFSISISEVMTDNDAIPGPGGVLCDWVELRNTGSGAFDLGGYGLSDEAG